MFEPVWSKWSRGWHLYSRLLMNHGGRVEGPLARRDEYLDWPSGPTVMQVVTWCCPVAVN